MALGVFFFQSAGLYTGGVTGLALVAHYWFNINLELAILFINAPFFILSFMRMGVEFTLKSIIAIAFLSLFIYLLPHCISLQSINPYFAGIMGGLMVGVGMLQIFRHKGSTGGFNVLVIYLQKTRGWNAGLSQMVLDFSVLSISVFSGLSDIVIASFLGAFAMNFAIFANHRPGRYISF